MKSFFVFTSSLLMMGIDAHYFFDRLLVNNTWSEPFEYIRRKAFNPHSSHSAAPPLIYGLLRRISSSDATNPSPTDYDYITPITDPTSPSLRCGRTSLTSPFPKTATVHAGSTVGFAVNTSVGLPIPNAPVLPWDLYPNLYHPGPATAWLSRAPSKVEDYSGDGPWFKILSVVGRTAQSVQPSDDMVWKQQWGTYQATNWTFSIPVTTPPGEYLLRFEHIYPLPVDALQGSQYYVNCAQIRIGNDDVEDVGAPGPLVEIPGVYTFGQKEIHFYADVGNETYDIRDFIEPKPSVWRG